MRVGEPIVDDFEIPNVSSPEHVGLWKYHAALGYHSMDDIQRSQVIAMNWYKNMDGFEHEYLVAKCRRPGGVKFYLRIERHPPDHDDFITGEAASETRTLPDFQLRQRFSKIILLALSGDIEFTGRRQVLKASSWISAHIAGYKVEHHESKAVDTVTRVDNLEGSLGNDERAYLIAKYVAFQEPFYVRDLAFLADTVGALQPRCQTFLYHSFWYTRSILNVATAVYRPAAVHGPGFERAGTYEVVSGSVPVARLTLSEDGQHETDSIREAFQISLESHTIEVQNRPRELFGKLQTLRSALQEDEQKRQKLERQLAERRTSQPHCVPIHLYGW